MEVKRKRVQTSCFDKSRTQTQHAQNANINNVVKRFTKTGSYTTGFGESTLVPQFGEWQNGADFYEQMCRVSKVKSEFAQLPAQVRSIYRNRPELCLEFMATLNVADLSDDMSAKMRTAHDQGLIGRDEFQQYDQAYVTNKNAILEAEKASQSNEAGASQTIEP